MIEDFKRTLLTNIKNIPGWRTRRKIIVLECDDWGGIRMPSLKARKEMIKAGLNISNGRFDRYDTLATVDDLSTLFEVLSSVKDSEGNPAVMTPFVVVANPDFKKIEASNYKRYFYEPFIKTLQHYYPSEKVFDLWKEGIENHVFMPELHGRDHTAVPFWMKELGEGDKELLQAFEHRYVSLEIPGVRKPALGFRSEFYFDDENQKSQLSDALMDSINGFYDIFGYNASVFAPGNGLFHPDFDSIIGSNGVKFLNVFNKMPYSLQGGALKYRYFISGQSGPGITYYTRNCAFEPSENEYNGVERTLKQISAAFRWGKPAIISTHRVNFVGAIEKSNRDHGLQELIMLLKQIVKLWPDVEFMKSSAALDLMRNKPN